MNKQLKELIIKHFGSTEQVPEEFKGILNDVNNKYDSYDNDFSLLHNSFEKRSVELQKAYQKLKEDAVCQKNVLQKIKKVIASITDIDELDDDLNCNDLMNSLIKIIEQQKYQEKEIDKLLLAVEQNPTSIVITDIKGNIEYVNPQFCTLTGYTKDEALGQNPNILKSGYHSSEFYSNLWETILRGDKWQGEVLNKKKNGATYWEFTSICAVKNNEGEVVNFLAIKENITERKKNRELLENQRRLFRTVIDIMPDAVYVKDVEGRKILANPIDVFFSGKDREEEVIGKTDGELYPTETSEKSFQEDINVIRTGKSIINNDGKLVDRNGVERILSISKVPLYDVDKNVSGIVGVTHDATQQKVYEKGLLDARTEAEQANKAKSEFLANVSHEIRTPLNAIIGFAEIMSNNTLTDKENSYHSKIILTSAQTLLALFNDILDISKIESGQMEVEIEPMNLFNVIQSVQKIFEVKAEFKKIKLETEIGKAVTKFIYLDEIRLHQILFNIIGNAVKFTEKGHVLTKVTMKETTRPGFMNLQIDVEDTGIGIPMEQQEEIFETFTQQNGQSDRKYGGTGLGLAISRRLAEKLNGNICLESKVGEGTTFTIVFKDVQLAEVPEDEEIDVGSSYQNLNFNNSKVLMVDDAGFNIDVMVNMADIKGVTFLAANSVEVALNVIEKQMPDLIFMDIHTPMTESIHSVKIIKNNPKFKQIPIIVYTASDPAELGSNIDQWFDDILTKPAERSEVIELLMKYLSFTDGESETILQEPVQEDQKLNKDCFQKLPILIGELEKNFLGRWEDLSGGLIIYEIEEFCNDLDKFNEEYGCNFIDDFTCDLKNAIKEYDVEKIQESLDGFVPLVDKLKNIDNQ